MDGRSVQRKRLCRRAPRHRVELRFHQGYQGRSPWRFRRSTNHLGELGPMGPVHSSRAWCRTCRRLSNPHQACRRRSCRIAGRRNTLGLRRSGMVSFRCRCRVWAFSTDAHRLTIGIQSSRSQGFLRPTERLGPVDSSRRQALCSAPKLGPCAAWKPANSALGPKRQAPGTDIADLATPRSTDRNDRMQSQALLHLRPQPT